MELSAITTDFRLIEGTYLYFNEGSSNRVSVRIEGTYVCMYVCMYVCIFSQGDIIHTVGMEYNSLIWNYTIIVKERYR